ncbi:6-hydroxymethylpterin diphosphokinase MptE-like protein [Gracilinema caldarium]|uniref:6-hydroxymethylpterin diphosphokinase MptE-like protein n=1 Tax=Gracilinema caldarium TaxID=215591 RepID=UPI0026F2ED4D|nr:6-hydroxymethylpterin diphosphokinase MptE-like protein [Gracilinema caldarium]
MMHEFPRQLPARRGFSLSYQGKTLLSTIDPIAQAEKAARTYQLKERTLYLIASPLFGYGISLILQSLPVNSSILALEIDEALFHATKDEFLAHIPAEVPYISTDSSEKLCSFVRMHWGPRRFRRVELITLNAGWTLYENQYKELLHSLQTDIATDWANAMTLTRMGRLYAKNALRNLPLLGRTTPMHKIHFGKTPLLMAAAGPSLDTLLDQLVREYPGLRHKETRPFRILCVDTALQSFIARSIPVDIVVALESQIWNLKDFVGYGSQDFLLAMDLSAHPGTLLIPEDKTCFFFTPWTELAFFKRLKQRDLLPTTFPPLGSVGLSATHIALTITDGPVYIAGLDFAFTPEQYHAKSSPGYQKRYNTHNRFAPLAMETAIYHRDIQKVLDINGQMMYTDRVLQRYRDLFVREFASHERLVDIRPAGLDLHIRRGSLSELFEEPSSHESELSPNNFVREEQNISILMNLQGGSPATSPHDGDGTDRCAAIQALLTEELASLRRLRAILSGEAPAAADELDQLIDYCDYLWAHVPECAAAGRQRPGTNDISFLKRVRAELDYFIKIVELALKNANQP